MTKMTTSKKPEATPQPKSDTVSSPRNSPPLVTLEELAREMKMPPRDARMVLRLAAKQTKQYPTLGKEHVARQPWSWTQGSKALEEARTALAAACAD